MIHHGEQINVRHGRTASAPSEPSDADALRQVARRSQSGAEALRLLTVAAIYHGRKRGEAAKIGWVTPPIIRDWGRSSAERPAELLAADLLP